jgi:hypothetical protein
MNENKSDESNPFNFSGGSTPESFRKIREEESSPANKIFWFGGAAVLYFFTMCLIAYWDYSENPSKRSRFRQTQFFREILGLFDEKPRR